MEPQTAYRRLDSLLAAHAGLWRSQPFKEARPAWCDEWPALAAHVLALSDDEVDSLSGDNRALAELAGRFVPELGDLPSLIHLPASDDPPAPLLDDARALHLRWEIPGRKAAQIDAFAAAVGQIHHPLLEWCGGKGHLGRLLAGIWQVPVETLDIDPALCAEGHALARRGRVAQGFTVADALAPAALAGAAGRHAVALHACGDLHVRLVREAGGAGLSALDVAPCCYDRTAVEHYAALSGGRLSLDRDALRLAVRDTVTVLAGHLRLRKREQAWKLGFVAWRRLVEGEDYRSFKPVPDAWLKGDFANFCALLAAREGLPAPVGDLATLEAEGWRRASEVSRLTLVRLMFRRGLEVWLSLDKALCLQSQGYQVRLAEFCPRQLTPRNILISARS